MEKRIRAKVIKRHLSALGQNTCVCFTCGNATKALRKAGLDVISVGEKEELKPNKWFTYTEIQKSFNGLFDATSGHLPVPLMMEIATEIKKELGELDDEEIYSVPTGSGETILCLIMAYPHTAFLPVRMGNAPTEFNDGAPLNDLLFAVFGHYGLTYK